ncbi:hypothetical protein KR074_009276 [Drosophila pseudoananassae]|nr:hypothetical protein KR074_009276 [Drosophila pseudoananassae]
MAANVLSAGTIGHPVNRIIGGSNAAIETVPWQVFLQKLERDWIYICGGSLIRPDIVLTAGHCVISKGPAEFSVRVGSSNKNKGGQLIPVAKILVHEYIHIDETKGLFLNDIAVLRLNNPVKISTSVQTIALATHAPPAGTQALITGWGSISPFVKDFPIMLQGINVTILSSVECLRLGANEGNICAGSNGKTACDGDSGGGLVVNNQVVGVVSAGSYIVITAAHCIASTRPTSLSVRVGSTDSNSGGQSVRVSKILLHEDYDENTVANDVAVLRLESRLTLNASVRAIPLAYKVPRTADSARVSGWGAIGYQMPASSTLLAADVAIVDQDQCNRAYGGLIQNVMICASSPGKDSCQGDSGGPLVSGGKLVGIVSFGNGCANPNYPGVYANVAKLRSWIRNAANRI